MLMSTVVVCTNYRIKYVFLKQLTHPKSETCRSGSIGGDGSKNISHDTLSKNLNMLDLISLSEHSQPTEPYSLFSDWLSHPSSRNLYHCYHHQHHYPHQLINTSQLPPRTAQPPSFFRFEKVNFLFCRKSEQFPSLCKTCMFIVFFIYFFTCRGHCVSLCSRQDITWQAFEIQLSMELFPPTYKK